MLAYVALCFALSPQFPFARVDMYADVGHRHEGAMPTFFVGGSAVALDTMTDFRGLDPSDVVRADMACSEEYLLDEYRNYLAAHQASGPAPADAVRIDFGWRRYHIEEDGAVVDDEQVVTASGTARVRR
jgi:hypothetical protein